MDFENLFPKAERKKQLEVAGKLLEFADKNKVNDKQRIYNLQKLNHYYLQLNEDYSALTPEEAEEEMKQNSINFARFVHLDYEFIVNAPDFEKMTQFKIELTKELMN